MRRGPGPDLAYVLMQIKRDMNVKCLRCARESGPYSLRSAIAIDGWMDRDIGPINMTKYLAEHNCKCNGK